MSEKDFLIDKIDNRSDEAKSDFAQRKAHMIELAQDEGCLSHILVLLRLAEAQAGFADEQALYDYERRNMGKNIDKGEPTSLAKIFKEYADSQSDWLRSLTVFIKAIQTEPGVPGLLEISNTQQKEWAQFESWCQKNFLYGNTLLQVKNSLNKDSRIKWADLQTFPTEKIRKIIFEAHKDRLMVRLPDEIDKIFVPIPLDGFTETPLERIYLSTRSAVYDTLWKPFAVATYLSPVDEKEEKPTRFFAHGLHCVNVREICVATPFLFDRIKEDQMCVNNGRVESSTLVKIHGGSRIGYYDYLYDTSSVKDGKAVDMFVDNESGISGCLFNSENISLLYNADELCQRSRGRIKPEALESFDLNAWYRKKLRELGCISSCAEADLYAKQLTLGVESFTAPEIAKEINEYFPAEVEIAGKRISIKYKWKEEKQEHEARIYFYTESVTERAQFFANLNQADIPQIGTKDLPVTIIYCANPSITGLEFKEFDSLDAMQNSLQRDYKLE